MSAARVWLDGAKDDASTPEAQEAAERLLGGRCYTAALLALAGVAAAAARGGDAPSKRVRDAIAEAAARVAEIEAAAE